MCEKGTCRWYQKQQPGSQGRPVCVYAQADRRDSQKIFELVKSHQAFWSVSTQCRVLCVSLSEYHACRTRPPSKRAKVDAQLKEHIKAFHTRSDGTYGAPRIRKEVNWSCQL